MGRVWNMLATAVLGGAKTVINQVLWASKLQTNISIKLLIEINPAINYMAVIEQSSVWNRSKIYNDS